MNHYAKITTHDGTVHKPVGIWDDGAGLRFYIAGRRGVVLLAAAPGLRIVSFGEREPRRPGQPRQPFKPAVFSGIVPADFATIEYLATCACNSPLKRYVAPHEWETADA